MFSLNMDRNVFHIEALEFLNEVVEFHFVDEQNKLFRAKKNALLNYFNAVDSDTLSRLQVLEITCN